MFFHNSCYFLEGHSVSDSIKKIQQLSTFFVYENGPDEIKLFQIELFQKFQISLLQVLKDLR